MKCKVRFQYPTPIFTFGNFPFLVGDYDAATGLLAVVIPDTCSEVKLRGKTAYIHLNTKTELIPAEEERQQGRGKAT